jgi:2-methylcitrate dehydratase PrpD
LGHPGAGIIPSAIVMAENRQVSGRRLIEAIVAGYEVAIRTSMAREMWKKDNVCTGHWVGFGAGMAAGKMILDSPEKIENTLGLVAMFNPELPGYLPLMRGMVKEGIPWAAMTGVQAALLSEAGLSGPIHVFDYLTDYYNPEELLKEIGVTYLIKDTTLKRYSCCAWIHPIVKLCDNLMKENQIRADEIDQVRVKTFLRASRLSNITNPETIEDAQFSIPFCCATVIAKGEGALYVLAPKDLHDSKIAEYAKKVTIIRDEEFEKVYPHKMKTKIEIEAGGEKFEKEYDGPQKGDSLTVFSREEVKTKYFSCAEPVIGYRQAKTLLDYIEKLDAASKVKIGRYMVIKN